MTHPIRCTTNIDQRCHWVRSEDGFTTLIPGCWPRVHDCDAPCTCGRWSEDSAAEIIAAKTADLRRLFHQVQQLRQALARAGLPDPTSPTDYVAVQAATKRRRLHAAISKAGQ